MKRNFKTKYNHYYLGSLNSLELMIYFFIMEDRNLFSSNKNEANTYKCDNKSKENIDSFYSYLLKV
jgi:hypothetical protein